MADSISAATYSHVVPVLDYGEHGNNWVIVMPRAEMSLNQYLAQEGLPLSVDDLIPVLRDIATALDEIGSGENDIVHRDLKPGNVLFLSGSWCLADFGIARYAEATTDTDTRKFSMTPHFAAPEQWRNQRATGATDVYAFGVIAYLLLSGTLPFSGPTAEDFREQHLKETPPELTLGTMRLRDLIEECLVKAPKARPSPAVILKRLEKVCEEPATPGFKKLADVNRQEVQRQSEALREASEKREREETRQQLHESAVALFAPIANRAREAVESHLPAAQIELNQGGGAMIFFSSLRGAKFGISTPQLSEPAPRMPFTVISEAVIIVKRQESVRDWEGRSHSLWFCDPLHENEFAWYEMAFMESGLSPRQPQIVPFYLSARIAQECFENVTVRYSWHGSPRRLIVPT